ncbi:hypothetical protein AB0N07_08845 [Streptomyces sp. NPDC051172]|uniref:hypothetical protein n=1 Tax=Streptomyces sp. NPDC051172 TaxID=3155796 RepID=UPI00341C0CF6
MSRGVVRRRVGESVQGFGDDLMDGDARVEGGVRVLGDDLQFAAQRSHPASAQSGQFGFGVEADRRSSWRTSSLPSA